METVKIKYKDNGAIKVVKKSLAGDYIGTGKFELVEENKPKIDIKRDNFNLNREEK